MARKKTVRRRKSRVGATGTACKIKSKKSPVAAKAAAAVYRELLPKSKKVTVKGSKIYIC